MQRKAARKSFSSTLLIEDSVFVDNPTIILVPHEFTLNANRALDGSVCVGLQDLSSRVVYSGCTLGKVTVGVVTTVTIPSEEHTGHRPTLNISSNAICSLLYVGRVQFD